MKNKNIDLIIVLPCYNEMQHISQSVEELVRILSATRINYELIFIDDCSTDNTARELAKYSKNYLNAKFFKHSLNLGRGATVSKGIIKANGNVVGFIDIDLEIPPAYILPCYLSIKQGYDLVIANRAYKIKISNMHRWILSKGYNYLVRKMLHVPFLDTEAGFKFFNKGKIMPILKEIKNARWFWDTEVVVHSYLKGYIA